MEIERNSFGGYTHMFSDDENLQCISDFEQDDDCDSGAGSDDFDLLELGETGEEFCQVGDQTCSIPVEIYDLPGLKDVLSIEAWNELLTHGERFGLARYLPDMDQEDFVLTLKELFSGDNLHFGSPLDKLFEMLKGGLCEPRVALYRQGLNFLQRRKHYHNLKEHHNTLVYNITQMRDAWLSCSSYSTEEKLRVLNIMKGHNILMNEHKEELGSPFPPYKQRMDMKLGGHGFRIPVYGYGASRMKMNRHIADEEAIYGVAVHRDQDFPQVLDNRKPGVSKTWKKHQGARANKNSFRGMSISGKNDLNSLALNKAVNQLIDIKVLTAMPSDLGNICNRGKRVKHADDFQQFNQMKARISSLIFKGGQVELLDGSELGWLNKHYGELFPFGLSSKHSDLNAINKRWKLQVEVVELQENYDLEYRAIKSLNDKLQANSQQNGSRDGIAKANQVKQTFTESKETESNSSEQMYEDDSPLMSKWAFPDNMSNLKYGCH